MVALTKRWATSSDASISTRVAVRVLRIETDTGHDGGEKVDQPYRHKKLGADRPIVPEFLQHLIQSPTGWAGTPTRHIS